MCTASWLTTADGYELFFNRDELRSRARGLPPRESSLRGVRYMAPIDLAGRGSWIAVNELGVTLCLLNRYPDPLPAEAKTMSRGLIVLGMADSADADSVAGRLAEANPFGYRPFTLLVAAPGRGVTEFSFDGGGLDCRRLGGDEFATSSSRDDQAARASRRELWRTLRDTTGGADLHQRFHTSHWPTASPLSVCMHREEAETESFCRVRVGGESVELTFVAGPPCRGGEAARSLLRRRATAAA